MNHETHSDKEKRWHDLTIWTKAPSELPTVPGSLEELEVLLVNLSKQLERIPFDRIGTDLDGVLRSLNRTLLGGDILAKQLAAEMAPEVRATVAEIRRALSKAELTLAPDSPLQHDGRETLREVTRAAKSVRLLADYLERRPEALIRGKREEQW